MKSRQADRSRQVKSKQAYSLKTQYPFLDKVGSLEKLNQRDHRKLPVENFKLKRVEQDFKKISSIMGGIKEKKNKRATKRKQSVEEKRQGVATVELRLDQKIDYFGQARHALKSRQSIETPQSG